MTRVEEAVKWMMTHDCSVKESLTECVQNKYNGDIAEFLANEFNVVENGCLHLKWGENKGEKVSYEFETYGE